MTNSGGSLTDLWPSTHRSVPLALFTAASFLGPVIAPIVGGFLTEYGSVRDSDHSTDPVLSLTDLILDSGDGELSLAGIDSFILIQAGTSG